VVEDADLGRLVAQRYRLIARLGSGGMATVYLARHVLIERLSALKVLAPALADDPVHKDRFLREARAVNRINHPNIVEITDYGEERGLVYLVMEYVPGESLGRVLARGPIGWWRAAHVGLQIAAALGRAHEMGVIHRDLKPGNVLLVPRRDGGDRVKLTDFGVAKLNDARTITASTVAMGTPGYVAPEYHAFGHLDARSDLYSLGVLLYEATTGTLPQVAAPLAPHGPRHEGTIQRLTARAPDVPTFFEEVVMTLLARDPDDRPRDGFEAFDLLRRALERDGAEGSIGPGPNTAEGLDLGGESRAPEAAQASAEAAWPAAEERARGPHLATAPPEDLFPTCARALAELDQAASAAGALTPGAAAALATAQRKVGMVAEIARLVREDGQAVQDLEARARTVRAELGKRLDTLGTARSRALGWAGTLAARSEQVRAAKDSGTHSVPVMDVMAWEHAALQEEEERARDRAADVAARIEELRDELGRENERLEAEMSVAAAQLEGHVAALRAIAVEAWDALEDGHRRLGGVLA
jgi:serine/threonine-protein kinase